MHVLQIKWFLSNLPGHKSNSIDQNPNEIDLKIALELLIPLIYLLSIIYVLWEDNPNISKNDFSQILSFSSKSIFFKKLEF